MGKAVKEMNAIELAEHFHLKIVPVYEEVEYMSTGILSLDEALGGGIARGRIQEIWGAPSYGKSQTTYIIIAQTLRMGGKAALLDLERSWDPDWAKNFFDIDDPNFTLFQKNRDTVGEDILEYIDHLTLRNEHDLIVLDSKDALVFRAELEGDHEDYHVGVRARHFTLFVNRLDQFLGDSKTAFLFVSQVRAAIGDKYNPLTTSGGKALEHFCAMQIRLDAPKPIKDGDKGAVIGYEYHGLCNKNKTFPKGKLYTYRTRDFTDADGVVLTLHDRGYELVEYGKNLGLFTNSSGEIYTGSGNIVFDDVELGNKAKAIELLRTDLVAQKLEQRIRNKMGWGD